MTERGGLFYKAKGFIFAQIYTVQQYITTDRGHLRNKAMLQHKMNLLWGW